MEGMAVKRALWRGRRVLVTGGAGFIGYAIASKLAELGAKVSVIDIKPTLPKFEIIPNTRSKIIYTRGSVASKADIEKALKRFGPQTVFHLAAEAIVARAL